MPDEGPDPVTQPSTKPATSAQPAQQNDDGTWGMGVSSDRPGDLGDHEATIGHKDTSDEDRATAATHGDTAGAVEGPDGEEVVPEQARGLPEVNPDGVGTRGHHEKSNPGHTHG